MSFCTITEIVNLTGTNLSSTILQEIIDQSDRTIKACLNKKGISVPSSDDILKAASINLSLIGVWRRTQQDGSLPESLSLGDISLGNNVEEIVKKFRDEALELIKSYILTHGSYDHYRFYVRKT